MEELVMERMAYLYLSSEKERNILLEKEQMKFCDFRRHVYLTDFLGFSNLNTYFWNQFSGQFKDKFEAIVDLIYDEQADYEDLEFDWQEQEDWIEEFCKNAPESEQKWLQQWILTRKQELQG